MRFLNPARSVLDFCPQLHKQLFDKYFNRPQAKHLTETDNLT